MSQRGFSATELTAVLAILAVLVPLLYRFALGLEDRHTLAQWHIETAGQVRTISEELRLDQNRGVPMPGEDVGWSMGDCDVRYRVTESRALVREASDACGGSRGLARGVESFRQTAHGIEITFVRALRPETEHRTTVFLPTGAP